MFNLSLQVNSMCLKHLSPIAGLPGVTSPIIDYPCGHGQHSTMTLAGCPQANKVTPVRCKSQGPEIVSQKQRAKTIRWDLPMGEVLPRWLSGREIRLPMPEIQIILTSGRSPGRDGSLQYSYKSMDRGAWRSYKFHENYVKKSQDMT